MGAAGDSRFEVWLKDKEKIVKAIAVKWRLHDDDDVDINNEASHNQRNIQRQRNVHRSMAERKQMYRLGFGGESKTMSCR